MSQQKQSKLIDLYHIFIIAILGVRKKTVKKYCKSDTS